MFISHLPPLCAALLLLFTAHAFARQTYYVAPHGKDRNRCTSLSSPCATVQRAVDLCGDRQYCGIVVAPGVYSQRTNVIYYKVISITGPMNADGHCTDPNAVRFDNNYIDGPRNSPIFFAQDHSILTLECLTLKAEGPGSIGLMARQFAIADANDIQFFGSGLAAVETSKINVSSPTINSGGSRFATAADLSQVTIGGKVIIRPQVTYEVAFVSSLFGSVVSVLPTSIDGGDAIGGYAYQCSSSILKRTVVLPGDDKPYPGNENCKVYGLSSDHNDESTIAASLADLTRSLAAVSKRQEDLAAISKRQEDSLAAVSKRQEDSKIEINNLQESNESLKKKLLVYARIGVFTAVSFAVAGILSLILIIRRLNRDSL